MEYTSSTNYASFTIELILFLIIPPQERLKSSINLEDLDEAIEKAMSSEIDYNFAIDTSGNLIRGRSNNGPIKTN